MDDQDKDTDEYKEGRFVHADLGAMRGLSTDNR